MTTTITTMPLEEYLRSGFEVDVDYVDDHIEERNVGELNHGKWQETLLFWFRMNWKQWNLRAIPEQRVRVSGRRVRIPDVTVIDRDLQEEEVLTKPPIAVFEIMSPEDRFDRMIERLQDYERMGVRNIFVIYKETEHFLFLHGSLQRVTTAYVPIEGSLGHIDFAAIYALRY